MRGGGAERSMANLATGLSQLGVKVDLVLGRVEGPFLAGVPRGVRIIDLHGQRASTSLIGLVRYLRRERPVSLLSTMTHTNLVAVLARRISRVPCRLILREATPLTISADNAGSMRGKVLPYLACLLYRDADGIVAISNGVASNLIDQVRIPPGHVQVIHNPVIPQGISAMSNEPIVHRFLKTGSPIILGAGRLTKAKDFGTLISSFFLVRQQIAAKLIILGEGEERVHLENHVKALGLTDDIDFPGFVSNPYAYMAKAKIFAQSPLWEGFGNVLAEAMACGTPVVSTNCPGGPRDILENGRWGTLVPCGDPQALADAILNTLSAPAPSEALKQRAREFTIEAASELYLRVLTPRPIRQCEDSLCH